MRNFGRNSHTLFLELYESICFILKFTLAFICLMWILHSYTASDFLFKGSTSKPKVSVAQGLHDKVRVFCLIMTYKERHDIAKHIARTWARHCNSVLFVSNEENGEIEPVVFNISKWGSLKHSLTYVYKYHFDEADWFLKVDDNSFVILENLRYLLYPYSPNTPIYFGCRLKDDQNQIFMHGSSGYVLSKEALRRFVTKALPNDTICYKEDVSYEDIEIGKCLRNVDVIAGDSRDKDGLNTFLPFSPAEYIKGIDAEKQKWYLENSYYGYNNESRRLSKHAISFSDVHPVTSYDLYYFIYQMRLFGRKKYNSSLADLVRFDVDQQGNNERSYESTILDHNRV